MALFFNDLSLHGQFNDEQQFVSTIAALMRMRSTARRFNQELRCSRSLLTAPITKVKQLQQVLDGLKPDQRRDILNWIARHGPFWTEEPRHSPDCWLSCQSKVVTDSAVGEAATRSASGEESALVTAVPSDWQTSPLVVNDESEKCIAAVTNVWTNQVLEEHLVNTEAEPRNWADLRTRAMQRFSHLIFADDSFAPLKKEPFVLGASRAIWVLLRTLNCFDDEGHRRAPNFAEFFNQHPGRFSDSSSTEQSEFSEDLTFRHPETNAAIFCPWHGKVQTPQLRIHFSWPPQGNEKIYVAYVGPKITKR